MANLIFEEFQGNFIKKDGVCYEFLQTTTSATNATADGVIEYNDCNECFNSSTTQIYAVNSAELNGTNQHFTYDQSIRNSVLGFSVWVNSDSIGATQRIIAESSTSGNIEVGVQLVVGKVRFLWRNSAATVQQLDSVTTLLSDTWYHLACTFDTSQGMKIYINGVLDSSNSNTGTISATTITGRHIGTYQDLLNFFDGNISMLSVYNRYLSQADVDTLYNNGTPLCYADIDTAITADCVYAPRLANWDTNAGQELVDQSASGITTTNVNSTPFTGTGLSVECTPSATQIYAVNSMFLGGAGNVDAPSTPITSLKDADQTWSIRFKPDTVVDVGTQILFTLGSISNGRSFRLYRNGSLVSVSTRPTIGSTSSSVNVASSIPLVAGQWHTVTAQVDINNTLSITVDGTKDSVAMGLHDINATYPISIGSTGGAFYNTGSYGVFRGWNRLLSDAEVTENELNSTTEYVCYNDLSTGLKSGLIVDVDLGNYNGGTTPLADNAGTLTFAEVGTVAYTGTGLNVECNVAPVYAVNSANLNGSSAFAEAPAPVASALQIGTQEFTVNIWVKSSNTSNVMQIINCDSGSPNYYDFYTFDDGGTPRAEFRVSGANRIQIDITNLMDGSWHLVALIKDNNPALTQDGYQGELRTYIDGVLQTPTFEDRTQNANSMNAGTQTEPITFGRRSYTNNQYFDGSLAFASVHVGTVLTPAQLLAEYNSGVPKCFADSPNESTITEGWNLGNYNNNAGSEYTGYKGIQDLTTVTSVTLTGTGLSVECST